MPSFAQLRGCIFAGKGTAPSLSRNGAPMLPRPMVVLTAAARKCLGSSFPGREAKHGGSAGSAPAARLSRPRAPCWQSAEGAEGSPVPAGDGAWGTDQVALLPRDGQFPPPPTAPVGSIQHPQPRAAPYCSLVPKPFLSRLSECCRAGAGLDSTAAPNRCNHAKLGVTKHRSSSSVLQC